MSKNQIVAKLPLHGSLTYFSKRLWIRIWVLIVDLLGLKSKKCRIYGNEVDVSQNDVERIYLAWDIIREPENLVVYRALGRSGLAKSFFDIGANCGHLACQVRDVFEGITLVEPNPQLIALLRTVFGGDEKVKLVEGALMPDNHQGKVTLVCPSTSTGLGSVRKSSDEVTESVGSVNEYEVDSVSCEELFRDQDLASSYVKVDIEGWEYEVLSTAAEQINRRRPIVGYEALTMKDAKQCATIFENYSFYCARFGFLDSSGSLFSSWKRVIGAILFGGEIVLISLGDELEGDLENFSQVFSVPDEKKELFESEISNYFNGQREIDLGRIRSWNQK